jgi:SAM-dependent MidA family methyltransferase
MSLVDRLKAEIAADGPISIPDFMNRCLHDPQDGYYATRPALGPEGDFITAPLVSQMFGELIGLWAVETWSRMGRPDSFDLIEIGPGDGTLMGDMLRAARLVPEFLAAAKVVLVERSDPLAALQAEKFPEARRVSFYPRIVGDDGPFILVANEFLDCLPAMQFVKTADGWAERRVGLDAQGQLAFGLGPPRPVGAVPEELGDDAPEGAVWEAQTEQIQAGALFSHLAKTRGGVSLLIDYGRAEPAPGDTLQALKRHRKVDPLATAGEADLTVWADFAAVRFCAETLGAPVTPILTQGEFLRRLGIEQRAAALSRARPDRAEVIGRQLRRLTAPEEMGELFKAVAIHSPGLTVPGFEV